jgi:hypothetical protein
LREEIALVSLRPHHDRGLLQLGDFEIPPGHSGQSHAVLPRRILHLGRGALQTSTGTPNTGEAERFMAKCMAQGDSVKPVRISLEEFGQRYMEYAKTNKRSWVRDEQMLKQLNGFYQSALLSDIGQLSVERYRRHRIEQVAPATVN